MHRFFLREFEIYEEDLPEVFVKYNASSLEKWGLLRYLVYTDVFQYAIPFILDIEREFFHKFIMTEFASL